MISRAVRTARWLASCAALLCASALVALAAPAAPTPGTGGFVARIHIDGPIGPASAEYFHAASARATHDRAEAILLQLDTPGGLSESMRDIIADILASPVPVIAWVGPKGARAASAGTYILYASHLAAMAPATHLGAATPVSLGGANPLPLPAPAPGVSAPTPPKASDDAERTKVVNDAIAYIRSLAELRGRNATWAEAAVRGAATLTADAALQQHVIDFIAPNAAAVLAAATGRSVQVGQRSETLALSGLAIRDYAPNWRTRFLNVVTNPTIAYLLLMAGIWGLVLEAFHPGIMWPGVTGAICLLAGLYGLQMLPVHYVGLALMALGVALLVGEVIAPTYGALGIGGVIAFVAGSIMLLDTDIPGYSINLGVIGGVAFAGISLLGIVLWLVMRARRAHVVSGEQQMLDATGEMLDAVAAGGSGWAMVYGERWRVRATQDLAAHASIRVTRRKGLLLWVAPLDSTSKEVSP